jgi:sugar (pentulose or hexulose) kinase
LRDRRQAIRHVVGPVRRSAPADAAGQLRQRDAALFRAGDRPQDLAPRGGPVRHPEFTPWTDPAAVRAVVEAQALSMRLHSRWMSEPTTLLATGGAAQPETLQVYADVFQARLRRLPVTNSAPLGAALRAANASGIAWALLEAFAAPEPGAIEPRVEAGAIYRSAIAVFARRLAAIEST